jgi:hypothetical protein
MSTPQAALPARARVANPDRWAWVRLRQVWAGIAIIAMWVAVLFVGIYGGNIVSTGGSNGASGTTSVPSAVVIAVFACIGTIVVARHGFRADPHDERR